MTSTPRTLISVAATVLLLTAGRSSSASKPTTGSAAAAKQGLGSSANLAVPKHPNNAETTIGVALVKVVNPSKPANQYNTLPAGHHQVALQFQIVDTGKCPTPRTPSTA